jgi:hypothetical protein
MKIIALTVAFTLMATLAASGDDVPFSAPPLPRPGEPDASNLESSGDGMKACVAGSIQTRWSCTLRDILVVLGAKGVAASYALSFARHFEAEVTAVWPARYSAFDAIAPDARIPKLSIRSDP